MLDAFPTLRQGPSHTTSSALHRLKFVGELRPWPAFKDLWQTFNNQQWDNIQRYTIPGELPRAQQASLLMNSLISVTNTFFRANLWNAWAR